MTVTVNKRQMAGVQARISGMSARAENAEAVWPRVGSYLSRQINRQFVTEGAHFGRPWKPLQPSYRLWKIRHGYSRKILVQTGQMRESFTKRPMSIEIYRKDSATFGSSNPKAGWHH